MKKAVVLGMILLALGSFAYADGGATVGMDFGRSQFSVLSGGTGFGSSQTTNQGWAGPGTGFPPGIRFDMQFAWANQYVGVNITDYAYLDNTQDLVNFYGTLKLVPDLFTAYIGRFQGDGWDHFRLDSPHPIRDVNNQNAGRFSGRGAILDLAPKDTGLDVAFFANLSGVSTSGVLPVYVTDSTYAVAGSYTVPNLLKISAGTNVFNAYTSPSTQQRYIFASVQLLMVPNLTLWDEVYYTGFDLNPSVTEWSNEIAGQYVMDKLTFILAAFVGQNTSGFQFNPTSGQAAQNVSAFYMDPLGSSKDYIAYYVEPEVSYNLGMLTVGVVGSLGGSTQNVVSSSNGYGLAYDVEPYIKLNNFGLRVSVNVFGFTGIANTTPATSYTTWEVPILVDWGF